jgi:hypothetical protein
MNELGVSTYPEIVNVINEICTKYFIDYSKLSIAEQEVLFSAATIIKERCAN